MIIISIIYPIHDQDAVTKTYADTKMSRSGGTMMGDIQMTDNRITGLSDPVNNQDATTKWYVDNHISSSMDTRTTAIFKQPLLEVGVTLAKIPLNVEGTITSGIILADPINIHITTGVFFPIRNMWQLRSTQTACSRDLPRGSHPSRNVYTHDLLDANWW